MTVLGGRYELGDLLGRGGMAEVYRAQDTVLNRAVAVKVFRHVESSGPDSDARRTAEVHLLAGLSHPGLVTVFDAGRGEDEPGDAFAYLVMEFVDGTNLRHRLDLGPLPPDEVARIGERLADALAYVHDRGIVHRDVKPANILLTTDGTPKLTDFGVARLLDSTRLTGDGTTVGTANYLSPEQASGEALTGASDVYSLGLVLLECLTGEIAYPGHGVAAAAARLHRPPAIPATLGPAWGRLLAQMTDRDPAQRPEASAVATALRGFVGDDDPDVAPTVLLAPVKTPRNRRPLWVAVTVLAVLAVAAGLALGLGTRSPSAGSGTTAPSGSATVPSTPATSPPPTTRSATSPTVVSRTTSSSPAPPASKPGPPQKDHGKPPKPKPGKPPKGPGHKPKK